jgi:cellulose synthase/poly-beta-1,6-N-acetylglucosamine synthase-like glycosyltransferase
VTLELVLRTSVLLCAAYLCVVYAMYVGLMLVGFAESRRRRRRKRAEDVDAVATSRFSPPVSILVPACNEESMIEDAVRSLLGLDYAQLEVIVVSDGSTDATIDRLRKRFDLLPVAEHSREVVASQPVRAAYRSSFEPRLLVLDKDPGGKADALNAALNHCRYPYVCGVDADTVFDRGALSTTMGAFMTEPGSVVGLTSFFETSADPAASLVGGSKYRIPDARSLLLYQTLDYLRAFFNNRVAWSRLGFMLCAAGAFQVWRRDLVDELGGWSPDYTCEDIEFTFRVHRRLREAGREYRVLSLSQRIGVTEGPDSLRKLVSQRERWQRVIVETWWANRRMCLNRRYGSVGLLGMPYYLLSEIVAPFFEVLAIATLVAGAVAGLMDWSVFALVLLLMSLLNSTLSTGALFMADLESPAYRLRGVLKLLALMPFELLVYRPAMSWARVQGSWRYVRGDKAWHKFERNVHAESA